jgi:hypothetical protein
MNNSSQAKIPKLIHIMFAVVTLLDDLKHVQLLTSQNSHHVCNHNDVKLVTIFPRPGISAGVHGSECGLQANVLQGVFDTFTAVCPWRVPWEFIDTLN